MNILNILILIWEKRNVIMMNVAAAFWMLSGILNTVWFPQGLPQPYQNIILSIAFVLTALGYTSQIGGAVDAKIRTVKAKRLNK